MPLNLLVILLTLAEFGILLGNLELHALFVELALGLLVFQLTSL